MTNKMSSLPEEDSSQGIRMASKTIMDESMCRPCSFRDLSIEASFWCVVCKEGLCLSCQKHHLSTKALASHDVLYFDQRRLIPNVVEHMRETCYEHDRKFEHYCSDHQEPCCIRCSTKNHKGCNNVCPIEDVIENVKSSVAIHQIEGGLNGLILKIEKMIEKKEKSTLDTEEQIKTMKLEVSDTKKCINERLEGLIKKCYESMDDIQVEHNRITCKGIESLQKKQEVLQSIKLNICQAKENCTNLQLFLSLSEFESMLSREENLLSVSMEKGEYDNTEYMLSLTNDFKNLSSIGDICNIVPKKKKLDINHLSFGQSAKMPLLFEEQVAANIDSIRIQKKCEMTFPDSCWVTGCTCLRDDSVLFVDESGKRIILFDSNSRFLRNIKLDSKPYDIAAMDDFVVVVTLFEAKKILFIDFSSDQDKVIKELDVISECYGIDYSDHRIAVGVKGYGIQIFDDTGIKIKAIPFASRSVSFVNSNICYIDYQSSVLKCTNYNGLNIWEITLPKALHVSLMAMTVDQNGNIYVSDSYGDKLYIVSSDGTRTKQQLQKSDGLSSPQGIHYNTRKQQLLLIANPSKTAVLYDVQCG